MILARTCFKIDKPNAVSMIFGYRQHGTIRHTAIWVDVKDRYDTSLLSFNRSPTRFTLSEVGRRLNADRRIIPYKYVAIWNTQYFIRNDMGLWNTICRNGLFDIWHPEAPYERLAEAESDPRSHRIILFRIFMANREFRDNQIVPKSSRIDHLIAPDRNVELTSPVVPDAEFAEIKKLLESSVQPYSTGRPAKNPFAI
jgi:hypothetical protein